jgi:putative ABC transport system permease protein
MVGFTIAFISVFYIYSYVSFELGYDSQHKKAERIYRISGDIVAAENTMTHAILGPLMGQGLKDEFPEVEEFTRLGAFRQAIFLENGEEKFKVEEAYKADHSVFDIFTLDFVYGSKHGALIAPNQIVINQNLSQKIFGDKNPVGKILKQNKKILTITGVIKDSPQNVHHKLNVLFSPPNFDTSKLNPMKRSEGYWMPSAYTFVLLKPKCNISAITENFEPFFNKHMATFGKRINAKFNLIAIPLKDLHFSGHMSYDYPKGNKTYTYILIFVALFIFLIALLNYGNLLVFQNITNSKNIGIKKIIGASSSGLYFQFLLNSLFFVTTSVVLAFMLFKLTLPYSKSITAIKPDALFNGASIFLVSVLLIAISAFTSSLVPFINQLGKAGLSLININNASLIKIKGLRFGKSVAVVQFALSAILIMASIAITKQLRFLIDSDMGFDKNNVVLVNLPGQKINSENAISLKNELNKNTLISHTAISTHLPGEVMNSNHFQIQRDGKTVSKIVNSMGIDYDYVSLMGMEIKKGRNFKPELTTDADQAVLVNEAFVDFCGFDDNIVGTKIEDVRLIGILKDACFNSLHNQAEPMVFRLNTKPTGYLNVKLNGSNIEEAVNVIKEIWESFFPNVPFEHHFLDQRVAMLYENDRKKNTLMQLFTLISIIISSMGFLNLSSIISKQKTKEIGIRKVNGAKVSEILALLNKDFIKWVAIAFVIAVPVAYYAMNKWLENFAYKTELSWWIFALAGGLALGIALLTVSWQSWKAATRNPVEALRYE